MQHNNVFFEDGLAQTTTQPFGLAIESAEGSYLYDTKGKAYLDMISGVAVSNIGHGHPAVKTAIKNQVDKHLHVMVYGEFAQKPQRELGRKMQEILPKSLDCTYFVNSGTEAIEAALKLAKRATSRTKIVACKGAYHGSTHGALSVSGNETKKAAFRPLLPEVYHIAFNAIDQLSAIDEHTACFLMEPIQGDAGVRIATQDFVNAARKRCDEVGALLIFDEIQTGFGRTGSMFCFEQYAVVPDLLCLAKGLGGGMPIGALAANLPLLSLFTREPMLGHITTFGGHPVCCAAALANIEVIQNERLVEGVFAKGKILADALAHPIVKEIRYRGLMFAIELENPEVVAQVVNYCLEHGVIGFWFLSCPESFRLAPPINISDQDLQIGIAVIRAAFDHVQNLH